MNTATRVQRYFEIEEINLLLIDLEEHSDIICVKDFDKILKGLYIPFPENQDAIYKPSPKGHVFGVETHIFRKKQQNAPITLKIN